MHFQKLITMQRALFSIILVLVLVPWTANAAVPAAPTNLIVTTVSAGQIGLAWTDNSNDEVYFIIEMQDAYGVYSQYNWTYANVTTTDLVGLASGTTYTFRVVAFNYDGRSYSDPVTATTVVIPVPVITSVTALSTSEIEIKWTDTRTDVMQYWIEVSDGGFFPNYYQAEPNERSLILTSLFPNTQYNIKMYSLDFSWVSSPYSDPVLATTKSDVSAPVLQATALSSKRIKLTWTDPTTDEMTYYVEYFKGTEGTYIVLDQLPADSITYTHTNLEAGATYTYRVRSFNGSYYGPYSLPVTVTTGCISEGPYIK